MATILVVDDEPPIREFVEINLRRAGFAVTSVGNGRAALNAVDDGTLRSDPPDLIVLDLMLPDIDGFELCRELRARTAVPIIMLTARIEDVDKILGLELGADDYITKPFNPRELVARIKSMLRRMDLAVQQRDAKSQIRLRDEQINDEVILDMLARRVSRDGKEIDLTPKEYELFKLMATHQGQVFSRETLLEQVWGYEYAGDTRTVDVHIRRLREKLEADPYNPRLILTEWGIGYKIRK